MYLHLGFLWVLRFLPIAQTHSSRWKGDYKLICYVQVRVCGVQGVFPPRAKCSCDFPDQDEAEYQRMGFLLNNFVLFLYRELEEAQTYSSNWLEGTALTAVFGTKANHMFILSCFIHDMIVFSSL